MKCICSGTARIGVLISVRLPHLPLCPEELLRLKWRNDHRDGQDSSQAGLGTPKPPVVYALLLAKTGGAKSQARSVETLKHPSLSSFG